MALYRQQFLVSLAAPPREGRHSLSLRAVDTEKGCPVLLKFFRRKADRNRLLETILQLEQEYAPLAPLYSSSLRTHCLSNSFTLSAGCSNQGPPAVKMSWRSRR